MRYFYNPPKEDAEGKPFPPFVFAQSGHAMVVCAHRYWKRVSQPYVIERFFDKQGNPEIDTSTGEPKVLMGKRTAYVLDEEMNARLDKGEVPPPDNVLNFTRSQWADLQQSKYAKFLKHLVSEEFMRGVEKKNFEELKKSQFAEIEKEKRLIAEERAALKAAMNERAALRAEIEADNAELKNARRAR